jgi:hypothetical protein
MSETALPHNMPETAFPHNMPETAFPYTSETAFRSAYVGNRQ